MAEISRQSIPENGLTPVMSAATAGGDTYRNTGRELLYIKNGSAAPVTVTVAAQQTEVNTEQHGELSKADAAVTIAAGAAGFLPRLSPSVFNNAGQASITYSASASVEIAVLTL